MEEEVEVESGGGFRDLDDTDNDDNNDAGGVGVTSPNLLGRISLMVATGRRSTTASMATHHGNVHHNERSRLGGDRVLKSGGWREELGHK